jgi:hypothetical protein
MRIRFIAAAMLAVAAMLMVAACGSDESDGEASGSFAAGDCAVSVDPDSTLEVEKVDCEDSSAEFTVTEVAASLDELGSCDFGLQMGDQAICMGAVGATPESAGADEDELDLSTLEPGDCTDASGEDPLPTRALPCDDPAARSEVLGEASDPFDCEGDVAAQRDGVVICMRSL